MIAERWNIPAARAACSRRSDGIVIGCIGCKARFLAKGMPIPTSIKRGSSPSAAFPAPERFVITAGTHHLLRGVARHPHEDLNGRILEKLRQAGVNVLTHINLPAFCTLFAALSDTAQTTPAGFQKIVQALWVKLLLAVVLFLP
jgi:hypothetical protein